MVFKRYIALMFDDEGKFLYKAKIKRKEPKFTKNKKSYNYLPDESSSMTFKGIFVNKIYYFYNVNNPNPILLNKRNEPIINSDIYNSLLETKVIREVNSLDRKGLSELLTPQNIMIALVVLGAIWYFTQGGTIT